MYSSCRATARGPSQPQCSCFLGRWGRNFLEVCKPSWRELLARLMADRLAARLAHAELPHGVRLKLATRACASHPNEVEAALAREGSRTARGDAKGRNRLSKREVGPSEQEVGRRGQRAALGRPGPAKQLTTSK